METIDYDKINEYINNIINSNTISPFFINKLDYMVKISEKYKNYVSLIYESLNKYGFYQVHQGYIVNFSKVKDFDGYTVVLKNNCKVLISVRKKREVLLAYSRYVEKLQ